MVRLRRPDLIINGVGSLGLGIVVTFVLRSFSEDNQSEVYWCFIAWLVLGTPCCLFSGMSSLLVAGGAQDPCKKISSHIRCDVDPVHHDDEEPFVHNQRATSPLRDFDV